MKNRILSILTAIAVAASLSACQAGDTGQTPPLSEVVVSEATTIASKSTHMSETTAPESSEEPKFVTEFEITDWTMEELVENFYLCGQKIVLPLHSNELCDGFDLTSIGYSSKLNQNMFALSYNGHDVAIISCNDYCSDDTDFVINNIQYDIIQQNPQINIMGITELSTPDEVKKILGEPNYIQDDGTTYRYIFSDKKQLMLSFNKDYNGIDFYHISYEEE